MTRFLIVTALTTMLSAHANADELGPVSDDEWSLWYCGIAYNQASREVARNKNEREVYDVLSHNFLKAAALVADPSIAQIDTKLGLIRRINEIWNERDPVLQEMVPTLPDLTPPPEGRNTPSELETCESAMNLPAFLRATELGLSLK